jgi:hypothetical protein
MACGQVGFVVPLKAYCLFTLMDATIKFRRYFSNAVSQAKINSVPFSHESRTASKFVVPLAAAASIHLQHVHRYSVRQYPAGFETQV